jgi:O-antigen ligase
LVEASNSLAQAARAEASPEPKIEAAAPRPGETDTSAHPAAARRHATPAWMLTGAWTGMGLVLWALFPMTATVLLPLCAIAPLASYWAARRCLPWYAPSLTTTALMLAAGYLLINLSWTLSLTSAAATVAVAVVIVGTLHIVLNTLPDLDEPPLRAMAVGALVGLGVAGALLCLEVLSDQSLRRFLIRLVPALQPSSHHIAMADGHLAWLAPYLPNAKITVLTLMFWPAALLVRNLDLRRRLKYVALAGAAMVAATVFASEHASSQVAFVGAGAVFALYRLRPRLAMSVVVAGWVAANLLAVPAAWLLYSAEAHRAQWLPDSARHRVVIWRYTAEQVHKAPLLGAGVAAARAQHAAGDAGQVAPGTRFELSTDLHSHNAYLQVWYEAGAVGAAIVLGLGLAVLWALRAFAAEAQPHLAATFTACALLVASAYSIWAPWFMATLAMAAIFAALGAALRAKSVKS